MECLAPEIPSQSFCQQQRLGQAEARPGAGGVRMETARHRQDRIAAARRHWFDLGEGEGRRGIRDRQYLGPGVPLDPIPGARGLGDIAERAASLFVCPPPHYPRDGPRQQAKRRGRQRPDCDTAALPEPHQAESQQRDPRQRDQHDQQRFRPVTPDQTAGSHPGAPEALPIWPLACRRPAASPSAKARRTSSVGAVRPRLQ